MAAIALLTVWSVGLFARGGWRPDEPRRIFFPDEEPAAGVEPSLSYPETAPRGRGDLHIEYLYEAPRGRRYALLSQRES